MARRSSYRPRRRSSEEDEDEAQPSAQAHWWTCSDPVECAASLWWWIGRQEGYRSIHALKDLIHEAIYYDRPLPGPGAFPHQDARSMRSAPAHLNIVMSMVDTATAKLTKRRPMPVISADDAGWSERLFARKTSRILRRKMGGSHVERLRPAVIRDFCIRGDGVMKVVRQGGDVGVDRIPVFELVWDEIEALYGSLRTLAHVRPVAREVLLSEYPEHAEAILDAPRFTGASPWSSHVYSYAADFSADMVEVAEGWHLPCYDDDKNGRHVLAIKGLALLRERWRRPRFPIVRSHWSAPTRGFRGTGLVEQLAGTQAKINDVLRDMQENLYYGSALKVFQPRGAGANKHHLRARHPVVIEYDGQAPQYVAPNVISPAAMGFLQFLLGQAYEIAGISQMSAASKNTLGAGASGRAIDTMEDIQSERFAHVESGWMTSSVDLGQCLVDEARDMYMEAHGIVESEDEHEPLDKSELAPWIAEHEWDKVEIDRGAYHLIIEPANFIPESRGGRLSYVAELSKAGLIPDPSITADLFDEPDVTRASRGILGPKHRIDEILEGCADITRPMIELMPDQYDNLPLLLLLAKGEMKDAQAARNTPPEVIERYTLVIEATKEAIDLAKKGEAAPSLPGMQAANMGAAPNALTLQPGLGAPDTGGAMPPGMPGAGMPLPPEMMQPGAGAGMPAEGMMG